MKKKGMYMKGGAVPKHMDSDEPGPEGGRKAIGKAHAMTKRGYMKGGEVGPEHGYKIIGKHFGPGRGNAGDKAREWHEEMDEAQVAQDPREGRERGENANFYHNMIHHGEGGMIAPGEAPLTVGPGPGSTFRGPVERLQPAGE